MVTYHSDQKVVHLTYLVKSTEYRSTSELLITLRPILSLFLPNFGNDIY